MLMRFDPLAGFDRPGSDEWRARRATMPVDAYGVGDRYFLHFDLPGVDPDSIDVTVERDTVTVTAERTWSPGEETKVLMRERPTGTVSRSFILGERLDPDRIEAGYDHGVLTLTIAVAEEAKPKKITVGAGDRALTG